jgi:hypothetical protein
MSATSMAESMSSERLKVMERAKDPKFVFLSLAHLIDEDALTRAFYRIRKDAAVGVDGGHQGTVRAGPGAQHPRPSGCVPAGWVDAATASSSTSCGATCSLPSRGSSAPISSFLKLILALCDLCVHGRRDGGKPLTASRSRGSFVRVQTVLGRVVGLNAAFARGAWNGWSPTRSRAVRPRFDRVGLFEPWRPPARFGMRRRDAHRQRRAVCP